MKQQFNFLIFSILFFLAIKINAQNIKIYPKNRLDSVTKLYQPGILFPAKTENGLRDFLNNGVHYNSIRLISIETAMEFATPSIAGVMAQLEEAKAGILYINARCDKLILPILKLPLWLSSSKDATILGDPNWKRFNAVPPANYALWSVLMDSIVHKINKQWGLDPYYEIWNEPDNFYWQGTPSEYFDFFKKTYFAIRKKHLKAKIGGPVLSSFSSKFGSAYPVGFISNKELDASIIGRLIDSCVVWKAPLDFISWHKFDSFLYSTKMEIDYLNQKLIKLKHPKVPYIISEWNNTFEIRESPFAAAFMPNYVLALENYGVDGHLMAALQDFDKGKTEFHKDYGMLSWAALHKPEWKALLLLNKLKGEKVKITPSDILNLATVSAIENDTLRILLSNRSVPAFVETTSYLFYNKGFNVTDVEKAGYDSKKLEQIYKKIRPIIGQDTLSLALKSVIPIYQHADTAFRLGREITLTISDTKSKLIGKKYLIDSTHNNIIYKYDSLLKVGFSREKATNFLYPNTAIISDNVTFDNATYSFHLEPNAVVLFEIYIPNSTTNTIIQNDFRVFANASNKKLSVKFTSQPTKNTVINIYNSEEIIAKTIDISKTLTIIDISKFSKGLYFVRLKNSNKLVQSFIKK